MSSSPQRPYPAASAILEPGQLLLSDVLANNGRLYAGRLAVVSGDERRTWAEFDRGINRCANMLLDLGLSRGDRVCLLMDTSALTLEMIWGVIRAGGVVAPLNPTLAPEILARMVDASGARFVFADAQAGPVAEAVRSLASTAPAWMGFGDLTGLRNADEALACAAETPPNITPQMTDSMDIAFTSGTTGAPKGIELSHLARHHFALGIGPTLKMDRFSVSICSTPLYTNGCWVLMIPALYWGGTVVLPRAYEPDAFLRSVEAERCTHLYLLPPQAIAVADLPDATSRDASSARVIISGGALLPDKTNRRLHEVFPNVEVHLLYGQSEGFTTVAGPADFALGKAGTLGKPLFGADLRLINPSGEELPYGSTGELVFRGPGLMKGYFNDPAATAKIVWRSPEGRTYLRTGDVCRIDEDGYLFFVGRAQDAIVCKGQTVFAPEIEAVFVRHPQVKEVAVVGIPHAAYGEAPVVFARLADGAELTQAELLAWGNERLAPAQQALAVEFRTEFARAALDKIQKSALRESYRLSDA